jgi:two-component system phosphate regulon sensor histidine kinase PhoR
MAGIPVVACCPISIFDRMYTRYKIKALLAACILIAGLLACIQYYLVRNTYQLTKDQYNREVKTAANNMIGTHSTLEGKILESFISTAYANEDKQMDRQQFLTIVTHKNDSVIQSFDQQYNRAFRKNTILKNVAYFARYDEFVVEIKGTKHVIAGVPAKLPSVAKNSDTANILQVRTYKGSFDGKGLGIKSQNGDLANLKLWFKGRQYVDISGEKKELVKRMSGIFLLASGLLIAVIILFYLMFSAILRQKKIAEIQKDFANNITHELKTPLSSVSVILKSLARKDIQDNPRQFNELLQSLGRQQAKIQQTMDTVLESAMLTEPAVEMTETDIAAYLTGYVSDLHLETHVLKATINPGPQSIKTNLPSLEKALNNLVDNAIKYSPAGSVISVNGYTGTGVYIIEVIDEGPGILAPHQNQIFSKFYRIPEQNKHTVKGLGLGLYIGRQAIFRLGGSLTLTSSKGQGCTFTIKLPLNES